jgi:hypothetical protein
MSWISSLKLFALPWQFAISAMDPRITSQMFSLSDSENSIFCIVDVSVKLQSFGPSIWFCNCRHKTQIFQYRTKVRISDGYECLTAKFNPIYWYQENIMKLIKIYLLLFSSLSSSLIPNDKVLHPLQDDPTPWFECRLSWALMNCNGAHKLAESKTLHSEGFR